SISSSFFSTASLSLLSPLSPPPLLFRSLVSFVFLVFTLPISQFPFSKMNHALKKPIPMSPIHCHLLFLALTAPESRAADPSQTYIVFQRK
uniref:Uncharacterized protein n=2 Tax=Cucumis melo TaxID=3656 RepID=A0A9I9CC96_CUCME